MKGLAHSASMFDYTKYFKMKVGETFLFTLVKRATLP